MTRHTPPQPFRRPARSARPALKPLLGILFALLGAGVGVLAIPWLIRVIPHDAARSGVIVEALKRERTADAVVFGSSIAMNSVVTANLKQIG